MGAGVIGSVVTVGVDATSGTGAGPFLLLENKLSADLDLTNSTDDTTNCSSSQKSESIYTIQGKSLAIETVLVKPADYSGSVQEALDSAAENMTDAIYIQYTHGDGRIETFLTKITSLAEPASHDAAIRKSFTLERDGDSTFT